MFRNAKVLDVRMEESLIEPRAGGREGMFQMWEEFSGRNYCALCSVPFPLLSLRSLNILIQANNGKWGISTRGNTIIGN